VNQDESQVNDVKASRLPVFSKSNSSLTFFEKNNNIDWDISRVFFIASTDIDIRGNHAHKKCRQMLISITGEINIKCNVGIIEFQTKISGMGDTLYVPAGIWVNLELGANSTLAVVADLKFEEDDYIRNWDEFIKFRGVS
jgi:hypothetical protein